jgi:septal ring factor EnvC (AmiA/AmiB activator)
MKRNLLLLLAGSILMLLLAPAVVAQNQPSLGEVARLARRHKPAPAPGERVYDNDNLPGKAIVNTVGPAPVASDQAASDQSASSDANKEKSAVPSNDEQKKINGEWTGKITQQKEEISRLERELNVLQRESKINAAVNAADLGTRLGNNAKYAEQDRQYQEQIAAKQKAVDDAKQKLADLQEEARKSGVPASARD